MPTNPSGPGRGPERARPFIPFTKPDIGEGEKKAVLDALETGHIGGNGPICRKLQACLQELLGVKHVQLQMSWL